MSPYYIIPLKGSDGILIKTDQDQIFLIGAHIQGKDGPWLMQWLMDEWEKNPRKMVIALRAVEEVPV